MNIWFFVRDFLACAAAVLFYAIIMSVPKKTLLASSLLGAVGYVVYRLIYVFGEHDLLGFLAASFIVAAGSEILARKFKAPAALFVLPGIIPLVPGVGLYQTMLCLVRNDMSGFTDAGVRTLFISGIIAVAVAVTNAVARHITIQFSNRKKKVKDTV